MEPFNFIAALKVVYESTQNKYLEAEKNYDIDNGKAKPYYDEALSGFKTIYTATLPTIIEKNLKECELALATAKELKAQTAFKKDYEAAVKQYETAKSVLEKKVYENAIKETMKAKELADTVNAKLKSKKN